MTGYGHARAAPVEGAGAIGDRWFKRDQTDHSPSAKSVFALSKNDSSSSSGVRGCMTVYGCEAEPRANFVVCFAVVENSRTCKERCGRRESGRGAGMKR